jgi:broad specificity phosphatase PhoE
MIFSTANTIALVRHGETDWNLERRIQGRTEVPLNSTGRAQAAATAARLAELAADGPWRGMLSSPLGRAVETAEILATTLGLDSARIEEALWERDFGPAEGLLVSDAHQRWPGLEIPGAEPLEQLAERSAGAMLGILDRAPGTIVVAHGALLRAGLAQLSGAAVPRILNGEIWLLSRDRIGDAASDGLGTVVRAGDGSAALSVARAPETAAATPLRG